MPETPIPLSRAEAVACGSKSFFTGAPCENGHIDKRYTNTGLCYQCKRDQMQRDYDNHRERNLATARASHGKHGHKHAEKAKLWVARNRERSREIKRNYKLRNREAYLDREKERVRAKRAENPFFRLSRCVSKELWAFLRGKKSRLRWSSVIGYDEAILARHLEQQFTAGMSWDNYGSVWEVDHIVPLYWFDEWDAPIATKAKLAWELQNLRPLGSRENRSRGRWELDQDALDGIRRLKARFPEKFSEERANVRDLEGERRVLEG